MTSNPRIQLAVSQCLLGEKVRYDGREKANRFFLDQISPYVTPVPICPEVEIGLTVPRDPIQLVISNNKPAAVLVKNPKKDFTFPLAQHVMQRQSDLDSVCGYIFKARSPSCGLGSTPVCDSSKTADGIFCAEVKKRYPYMSVIDEAGLENNEQRDHFFENVFFYFDWIYHRAVFYEKMVTRYMMITGHSISEFLTYTIEQQVECFFNAANKFKPVRMRVQALIDGIKQNPEYFEGKSDALLASLYEQNEVMLVERQISVVEFLSAINRSHQSLSYSMLERRLRSLN